MVIYIFFTCEEHYHDGTISLRGEVLVHKTRFNSASFYWSTCTKLGKWVVMYSCVKVSILLLSMILII